jgi:holo-[acyl-carrier protein] synthase
MERAILSPYFVRRLFRPSEIAYAEGKGKRNGKGRADAYASAFAAREAFAKASGVSLYRLALSSRICLERTEGGPRLVVPPELDAAFERGEKRAWVSLSHDGDYAVAVVVIEKTSL